VKKTARHRTAKPTAHVTPTPQPKPTARAARAGRGHRTSPVADSVYAALKALGKPARLVTVEVETGLATGSAWSALRLLVKQKRVVKRDGLYSLPLPIAKPAPDFVKVWDGSKGELPRA
jgi:hypothetical protein